MKKYTAVIPVKKNSSRLPGKNLLPFGDSNLLVHKIRQLKSNKAVSRIIVSSDSEEMLSFAEKEGVEGIMRPLDLANESRPLSDFFDYITTLVPDGYLLWTCCTSPLFTEKELKQVIDIWNEIDESKFDSLITVHKFKHYLMDDNGPLNYQLGTGHLNSQDLPEIDLFTNGCLISHINNVKKWRYNYGATAYRFNVEQDAAVDIDTKIDYEIAKSLWEYRASNNG